MGSKSKDLSAKIHHLLEIVKGVGGEQYNMVQRTDGTFLIVPRFLTAGVVTKRFQLKVKETGEAGG